MRYALIPILFALAAAAQISPDAIKNDMTYLASDELQGRETGTVAYDAAASWFATQLHDAGVFTQYQPVAFRTALIDPKQSTMSIGGTPLTFGTDFILRGDPMTATLDASAQVVFAGFGVVAPELKHNDYANIDAHGKIVAILSGAPASFPHDQRAYYASAEAKRKAAIEHGAIAIITIPTETDEKRYPFAKRAGQLSMPVMVALSPEGKPLDDASALHGGAVVNRDTAARLFAKAPLPLDRVLADAEKSISHSFPLDVTATMHTVSIIGNANSENVVGIVRGNDPKLRDETVVVSAHLDHLGNHPPANGGDGIYNGALDNASGASILLEMAKAMARAPAKRSVAFVALTAEEKGEQGSQFFARYPSVIRRGIVANVNMDMFLMLYPVADVVILGGEHSTLGPLAMRAAHESGFAVSPDPLPQEVRFIRSDQFSFVKAGIPAISIKAGDKSRDPKIDGAKVTREWMREIYHSPKDDMSQHLDFASAARYAEMNLKLVRMIADANERPRWKKGDFFARLFGGGDGAKATVTIRTP